MKSLRFLAAGSVAFALATASVRADDLADLKAKLAQGVAGVTSVRMVMTTPAGPGTMTVVFPTAGQPRGLRAKIAMTGPQIAMSMYIVDGYMYQSINGSRWEKRPLPNVADAVHLGPAFDTGGTLTPLPDRVEDGTTYGAFSESPPAAFGASPALTFTCTYDKTTGRVHQCSSQLLSMTYTGYNDPANVVDLPASTADAIELPAIPLQPPGAAPQPVGSP